MAVKPMARNNQYRATFTILKPDAGTGDPVPATGLNLTAHLALTANGAAITGTTVSAAPLTLDTNEYAAEWNAAAIANVPAGTSTVHAVLVDVAGEIKTTNPIPFRDTRQAAL